MVDWIGAIALLGVFAAPLAPQGGPPDQKADRRGRIGAAAQAKPSPAPLDISGALSRIRLSRRTVVRDSKAWESLWNEHAPGVSPPAVDFKRYDVVGVFAGQKPTGGYSVRIDAVTVRGKSAVVDATILRPSRGSIVTQMITYPFAMRAVAKLPKDVQFHVHEEERK